MPVTVKSGIARQRQPHKLGLAIQRKFGESSALPLGTISPNRERLSACHRAIVSTVLPPPNTCLCSSFVVYPCPCGE